MPLAAAATFALCLWIVMWSIGVKALDGMLLVLLIVVVAAGIKILSSKLQVTAYGLKGIEASKFAEVAKEAEGKCPVSNAYRGTMQITVDAKVA